MNPRRLRFTVGKEPPGALKPKNIRLPSETVMSSLKQLKVVKSSISGRVEVELSCSAMMLSTMSGVMP